jgi:hypothetical protein
MHLRISFLSLVCYWAHSRVFQDQQFLCSCVILYLSSVLQFNTSVRELTGQIGGSFGGDHEHSRILTGGVEYVRTPKTLYVFGGSLQVFLDFELHDR